MNIVALSGGLSSPSSTSLLRDRIAEAVKDLAPEAQVQTVDLRDFALAMTNQMLTHFASPELAAAQAQVMNADALVLVSPVYAGSYSGLFKTFFDLLEPGSLEGKPVLLAATGGTARHSLVIDHALRPLFSYLRALTLPTGVFAATEDFASHELQIRVARAAEQLVQFVQGVEKPVPQFRSLEDQFDAVTPFEQLLAQASK